MNEVNIYIPRGDSKTWKIIAKDKDGNLVPINTAEIRMTVNLTPDESGYIFQRKNANAGGSEDEIEMTDPDNGEAKIHVVPTNTSGVRIGKYVYDIEVIKDGKTMTGVYGTFEIKPDVTR